MFHLSVTSRLLLLVALARDIKLSTDESVAETREREKQIRSVHNLQIV